MNLREMLEKRAEIQASMEALDGAARGENRDMTADEKTQWDVLDSEFDAMSRSIERAQTLEARRKVMGASAGTLIGAKGGDSRQAPALLKLGLGDTESRAMLHYVRTGDSGGLEESRSYNAITMNVATPAQGEVLVPVGMVRDIVAKRDETILYPRLGVVRVPGKGTTVNYPIDNEDDVLFLAVTESGAIGLDAPAVAEKAFTLAKYCKYISLTWEILRDEDATLVAFINNWIGRGWAATHNKLLITEALAHGTAGLTLNAGAAIGATEIPALVGKVLPEYQNGAQWLMHPTTHAYLQGLTGNPFQFVPTPFGGTGPSLAGYPVNQSSYMTALGPTVKSLLFGNFQFMGMREGTGLTMLRDPYTAAVNGQVRLWFWFDAVYGVLQAEALQYATHPSA